MSLIVETGAGLPDADSYADVAEADAYINKWHDPTQWIEAGAMAQERSLRRATRFIDAHRFLGWRLNNAQALDWPRDNVGYVDGQYINPGDIPAAIKRATIEAALREIVGDSLLPDHDGGTIKRLSEEVGPIKTETEFERPRGPARQVQTIQALLAPYLESSGSRRLARAFG